MGEGEEDESIEEEGMIKRVSFGRATKPLDWFYIPCRCDEASHGI